MHNTRKAVIVGGIRFRMDLERSIWFGRWPKVNHFLCQRQHVLRRVVNCRSGVAQTAKFYRSSGHLLSCLQELADFEVIRMEGFTPA